MTKDLDLTETSKAIAIANAADFGLVVVGEFKSGLLCCSLAMRGIEPKKLAIIRQRIYDSIASILKDELTQTQLVTPNGKSIRN